MNSTLPPGHCDVAILGAGPTGLALALALGDGPWQVTVFDAAPPDAARPDDPRVLALSEGSRQLLARFDAWPAATPIHRIDVSQDGGLAATGLYAGALGLPALGHVARYGELLGALRTAAERRGINIVAGHHASAVSATTDGALVRFEHGATVSASLVVHAEGSHDEESWRLDYRQCAIVCEGKPTLPSSHEAFERFTPDGPLALLPLGDDFAVVRVVPAARRVELLGLDDEAFGRDLTLRLGHRVRFSALGPRRAFPLALQLRPHCQRGREVWIGNAAQTLHPVSGQGFNLGLRDAWTLAETLHDGALATRSAAIDQTRLAAWARRRLPDRLATTAFTDGIVRLFSNDFAPLHQARELGLGLFDLVPGLRNFVARRMIWGARGW